MLTEANQLGSYRPGAKGAKDTAVSSFGHPTAPIHLPIKSCFLDIQTERQQHEKNQLSNVLPNLGRLHATVNANAIIIHPSLLCARYIFTDQGVRRSKQIYVRWQWTMQLDLNQSVALVVCDEPASTFLWLRGKQQAGTSWLG